MWYKRSAHNVFSHNGDPCVTPHTIPQTVLFPDLLQIDRTSCCLFSANQLRVFLTAAAYVLMQELRLRAARTACARSQVTWLRDRLLKLGVHVVRSVRRVVLHLPRSTPHLEAWRHIALALGARAG